VTIKANITHRCRKQNKLAKTCRPGQRKESIHEKEIGEDHARSQYRCGKGENATVKTQR